MSEQDDKKIDKSRRRFLIGATSAMGVAGTIGAAVPFVGSWTPSQKAKAAGAPVRIDISTLKEGEQIIAEWRGKPIWVIRRTQQMISDLDQMVDVLLDPESSNSDQPEYADNLHRSLRPDILVLTGVCTHLGCSPTYRPEKAPKDLGDKWMGGFLCACHNSRFDLAGRVFKGAPASKNLAVPPYSFENETTIVVGIDKETA